MRRMTATEVARQFADVLDGVERTGETIVVERRGRPIASISPAAAITGGSIKELLREHGGDPVWEAELAELREMLVEDDRTWND